jgi:hypothetical protein
MGRKRRGTSTVQWVIMVALIGLVLTVGAALVGTRTSTKLNQSATDVASPSSLVNRFGS